MFSLFMKLLTPEKRALFELILRVTSKLATAEERKNAANYCLEILDDGRISPVEWAKFGKKLGVFRLSS